MEMMNSESRADGENFEKYEQLIPECMLKLTLLSTQLQLLDIKSDKFWNHKESLFLKHLTYRFPVCRTCSCWPPPICFAQ